MRKKKNPGLAIVLGIIFGPLGLLYVGVGHVLVSLIVTVVAIGVFSKPGNDPVWFVWSGLNALWAFLAARSINDKIDAQAAEAELAVREAVAARQREEEEARAAAATREQEEQEARAAAAARWPTTPPVQVFPTQPLYVAQPMPVAPATATASGRFCASCGAWVAQSSRFCGDCGVPMAEP